MKKHLDIERLIILSLAMILYLIGHMIFAPKDLEGWYISHPGARIAIVSIFLFMLGLIDDLFVAIFGFNFQNLVCRNHQQEFKFFACRWQGKPLDAYVALEPDRGRINPEIRCGLFHLYAKDSDVALRIFPLGKILNASAKAVVFNNSPKPLVSELVHAKRV